MAKKPISKKKPKRKSTTERIYVAVVEKKGTHCVFKSYLGALANNLRRMRTDIGRDPNQIFLTFQESLDTAEIKIESLLKSVAAMNYGNDLEAAALSFQSYLKSKNRDLLTATGPILKITSAAKQKKAWNDLYGLHLVDGAWWELDEIRKSGTKAGVITTNPKRGGS